MDDTTQKKVLVAFQEWPDVLAELDALALATGVSRGAMIRMLIRAAIREAAEKITATPQTN
jgi:hypothetical protein